MAEQGAAVFHYKLYTTIWLYILHICIKLIKIKYWFKIPISIIILYLIPLKFWLIMLQFNPREMNTCSSIFYDTCGKKGNWWINGICTQAGFNDLISHLGSDEIQWLSWTAPILPFISANFSSAPVKQKETAGGV